MSGIPIFDRKFVVTGGAGFIGSHLVEALLDRGAREVVVVDSLRYGDRSSLTGTDARVRLCCHTLGSDPIAALEPALRDVDGLFHLAAEKHNQSKDAPTRVLRANVEGSQEIFAATLAAGAGKIVFSSSLYAYGRMHGPAFREDELAVPSTVYGVSKLSGEQLLRCAARQHGCDWLALRYLFVYGPRQFAGMGYKSVIVKSFERILAGAEPPVVFGDGQQTLDYVFVDDVVDATITAMTHEASGEVLNVGSGVGTRVIDLVDTIIELTGSSSSKVFGPADETHGSVRVGDVTRIAERLGWRASTSLEQGLRRTLAWMRRDH